MKHTSFLSISRYFLIFLFFMQNFEFSSKDLIVLIAYNFKEKFLFSKKNYIFRSNRNKKKSKNC